MEALQGEGWGTGKEAELRPPSHHDRLGHGSGSAQAHKQDRNRGSRCGCYRVQHDAQLAMIGVGRVRVQVRDLRYGQEGQQGKAHGGDNRQKADATLPEPLRPES